MKTWTRLASIPLGSASRGQRYGLAILAAITALFLRQLLAPIYGEQNPYHTVWAAVVFSAWYCGAGPAIAGMLVDLLGIWYWFLSPPHSFQLANARADIFGMVVFVLLSSCIIALGESHRRSLARRRSTEEQLRAAHADLECRVEERTAELNAANASLRELSSRLQQMRDEERRQLARELHDSAGQILAALGINLALLKNYVYQLDPAAATAVSDSAALVDQLSREIRTISHLLHPPLLDLAGLSSALRWYADGFSSRSQIEVVLDLPPDLRRLPQDMELAIFRMVQECLTNIHRHSGSTNARITLWEENGQLLVRVKDSGKGISLDQQLELDTTGRMGIGFRGMRERLRQLGGDLNIESNSAGTLVTARLPLREETEIPVKQQMVS